METPAIRAIEPSIAKPVSLNRRAMIAPTRSENRAAIRGLFHSHSPDQMERGLMTQIAAPTTRTIKIREGTSKDLTWPGWMATLRPSIGRNLDNPPVAALPEWLWKNRASMNTTNAVPRAVTTGTASTLFQSKRLAERAR